jgi:hypothetical protein
MEKLFGEKERSRVDYFPRYYFVLVPLGDSRLDGQSSEDQFSRVLNALKREMLELRDFQLQGRAQERAHVSSKREILDLLMRMEDRIERVEEKVVQRAKGIEDRLGAIEKHLLMLYRETKSHPI